MKRLDSLATSLHSSLNAFSKFVFETNCALTLVVLSWENNLSKLLSNLRFLVLNSFEFRGHTTVLSA